MRKPTEVELLEFALMITALKQCCYTVRRWRSEDIEPPDHCGPIIAAVLAVDEAGSSAGDVVRSQDLSSRAGTGPS